MITHTVHAYWDNDIISFVAVVSHGHGPLQETPAGHRRTFCIFLNHRYLIIMGYNILIVIILSEAVAINTYISNTTTHSPTHIHTQYHVCIHTQIHT